MLTFPEMTSPISPVFPSEAEFKKQAPEIPKIKGRILIGGKLQTSGFEYKKVLSPCSYYDADGSLVNPEIGLTPNVGEDKLREAVDAASKAWAKGAGEWPTSRMEERLNAIAAFRDQMLKKREVICRLLMWEIAKNWTDAQAEFDRTIVYINDTIEEAKQLDRDCSRIQFAGGLMAQIRRAPLGVTLCMGPFNYPLNETFTTLIPALVMGNPVVVKVARFGQLVWEELLEPFQQCLPAGVVNIINGRGRNIIGPIVKEGKIDVLAFIGSSGVANSIKLAHPQPHHFRSILGLDAKNPAVILPDADLEIATSECLKGSLSFNGQRCTALKMLFVHKSISKTFADKFIAKVDSLKCGLPWNSDVMITPLPDFQKPIALQEMIADAEKVGAKLANPERGGKVEGSLMFPAVITGVPLESQLAKEEQFGPVVPILEYDSLEDFENYMLDTPFGMQASIFSNDAVKVGRLIDILSNQVCRINLNTQCQRGPDIFPFTGRKGSAEGTLSVFDALRSFSIRSMVAGKQDSNGKQLLRGILEGDHSRFLSTNVVL